jgi:7-cyano-7-deazaguanine synthase
MAAEITTESRAAGALVLFSGGQDSTVCLAWALERYPRVETVGFDYGQRHSIELETRLKVRERLFDVLPLAQDRLGPDHVLDIKSFGEVAESALTRERAIEMTERGLPSSFVPGRNLVFFVYAAALADRRGLDHLVAGMCETDYSGYPDCRRDTLDAQEKALALGMERHFRIETPLMWATKAETWAMGEDLGGPEFTDVLIEDTHSCYLGDRSKRFEWGYGCGTCPACELRAQGFAKWRADGG